MKKRSIKTIVMAILLCLAMCFFAACGSAPDGEAGGGSGGSSGGGTGGDVANRLASVAADSIVLNEEKTGYSITWTAVPNAKLYKVTCNGVTAMVSITILRIQSEKGFEKPADGVFNISIVAGGGGAAYADSLPTQVTIMAKGVKLDSPAIKTFNNGVLEWNAVEGAVGYKVVVGGQSVVDNTDGKYHATTLDTKKYTTEGPIDIEVIALCDGSVYAADSNSVGVTVNAQRTKLTMAAVKDYTVKNGIVKWSKVPGAKEYKVVDIYMQVVARVPGNGTVALEYDTAGKNLVYGVYPVSNVSYMSDADITPTDIPYLNGRGTAGSPYEIKTPVDLRAIDYYELRYAEKKAAGGSPAINNYLVVNDLTFDEAYGLPDYTYTLAQPFYGVLDGNGCKFSGIKVEYDGGYWALFDFIATGATVKNVKFDAPEITNVIQNPEKLFPVNASIATVADRNYGTISDVTVTDANYSAAGGEVSGICSHNFGVVTKCTVSGEFVQELTGQEGQACYEMAGIVLENYGTVTNCNVPELTIRGSMATGDDSKTKYGNVRTVGGVVAVNRKGAKVANNRYTTLAFNNVVDDFVNYEFGGIVAYNAGQVIIGNDSNIGTFTMTAVTKGAATNVANIGETGTRTKKVGKRVGSNDTANGGSMA